MITVQKILFLRNVPLFSGMPARELSYLAGIAEEVVYPAGQQVIRQGEPGDSMFLIVEGEVKIHSGDRQLAVLKERDHFGEMSLLDGEPRSASASAEVDCLLLRINQSDFFRILSRHIEVALSIIRTLTRRLRNTAQPGTPPLSNPPVEPVPDDPKPS